MSNKLNRDEILREILSTLIRGWGSKAVYDNLDEVVGKARSEGDAGKRSSKASPLEPKAVKRVEKLKIPEERKDLMLKFARDYEAGSAFPKLSDVKTFLASHHCDVQDVRSRDQAFRRMLPIIEGMSEKGLLKLMSRSHHSGPAQLGSLSDAIKDTGQNWRERGTNDAGDES